MAERTNRYAKVLKANDIIYDIVEGPDAPDMTENEKKIYQCVIVGPYAEIGQLINAAGGIGEPPQVTKEPELRIPERPVPPADTKLAARIEEMAQEPMMNLDEPINPPPTSRTGQFKQEFGSTEQPQPEPVQGSGPGDTATRTDTRDPLLDVEPVSDSVNP